MIERAVLSTVVGCKQQSGSAMLCYSYGVTRADTQAVPQIRAFVVEQTPQQLCACETRNPSGRCCLADFPRT